MVAAAVGKKAVKCLQRKATWLCYGLGQGQQKFQLPGLTPSPQLCQVPQEVRNEQSGKVQPLRNAYLALRTIDFRILGAKSKQRTQSKQCCSYIKIARDKKLNTIYILMINIH